MAAPRAETPTSPLHRSSPVLFLQVEQMERDLANLRFQVAARDETIVNLRTQLESHGQRAESAESLLQVAKPVAPPLLAAAGEDVNTSAGRGNQADFSMSTSLCLPNSTSNRPT